MIVNKKKILLVDDEEILRLSFKRELQRFYDVALASCYDEALDLLAANRFDMLISDIVMPGQNGLELLKNVKINSPETLVIIITGYGEIGTVIETMRAGADDFLLKPFDVEELLLRIGKAFEGRDHLTRIRLYEKIFSTTADAIALVDKRGVYLEANNTYLRVYGRSREKMIGSSMAEIVGRLLFNSKIASRLEHCFSGATVQQLDLVRSPDQEVRSMAITYSPVIIDGATAVTAAAISMKDVTEILHDSIGLQKSEERLRLVHSVSVNGFMDCDLAAGTVYYCNNWQKLLGYAPGTLEKSTKSWQDLLHPDDKPSALKALQDCLDGLTEFYDSELRLQRVDGSWMWFRSRGMVVERDGKGVPLRLVGLLSDITEAKSMQQNFLHSKEQLEQSVAQQTDTLAMHNKELTEANAALTALLNRRRQDRVEVEEQLSENVVKLVEPLVKRLQRTRLDTEQARLLGEIEDNLRDITSSFVTRLTSEFVGLTPMEIQVATHVKQGKGTKEIADILCLAPDTINVHRKKIRKKLGISNKSINLQTFLTSLSEG